MARCSSIPRATFTPCRPTPRRHVDRRVIALSNLDRADRVAWRRTRPAADLLGFASLVLFCVLIKPAVPLEHFGIRLDDPIEGHSHLPWPGKDLRVLNRRFVLNVIAVDGGIAFHHMQSV